MLPPCFFVWLLGLVVLTVDYSCTMYFLLWIIVKIFWTTLGFFQVFSCNCSCLVSFVILAAYRSKSFSYALLQSPRTPWSTLWGNPILPPSMVCKVLPSPTSLFITSSSCSFHLNCTAVFSVLECVIPRSLCTGCSLCLEYASLGHALSSPTLVSAPMSLSQRGLPQPFSTWDL